MNKKHGELKIMTAKEMIDMFCDNYKTMEFDFTGLSDECNFGNVPSKYLNIEAIYSDYKLGIANWCGIRSSRSEFSSDVYVITIGTFGYGVESVFDLRDSEYEDMGFPYYILEKAIADSFEIITLGSAEEYDKTMSEILVLVEFHDETYKKAQEELKVHTILNEYKERMAV